MSDDSEKTPSITVIRRPSVCRIVLYRETQDAEPLPAIITKVWTDHCVDLQVFGRGVSNAMPSSVMDDETAADNAPRWDWPSSRA